jgi:hypothetical protein
VSEPDHALRLVAHGRLVRVSRGKQNCIVGIAA